MTSDREGRICKVLLVEDNTPFRKTLKGILESHFSHLVFEEAADGKETLKKLGVFLPDLIFMDIKLPGKGGLELTREIRESYPKIYIIILTNHDLPEYRKAAIEAKADYFLSKGSLNIKEMMTLVAGVCLPRREAGD